MFASPLLHVCPLVFVHRRRGDSRSSACTLPRLPPPLLPPTSPLPPSPSDRRRCHIRHRRRPLPVPLSARRFPLALPTGRLLWERECATGAFSKRRMGFATLVERAAWCQPVKRGIYRTVFCQRSASYSRQRNKVLNSGSNQSAEMIMLQTPVSHAVSLTHPCGSAGGTPLSPVITARAVGDDIIS